MLKTLVPMFRPHLFARLKNIAEKHVPAKLKPIVEVHQLSEAGGGLKSKIFLSVHSAILSLLSFVCAHVQVYIMQHSVWVYDVS